MRFILTLFALACFTLSARCQSPPSPPSAPPPQPSPPAPDLVEQVDLHHLCAKDDEDMRPLYEQNLYQDLFYWQARLNGSKLNRTHLLDLFDSMAGKFGREGDRGVSRYISSEHNVVLIKDNKWYTPFRPFEYDTNCTAQETWCDGRMMFSQWAFERWTKEGMTFPDTLFFHDIGDAGACFSFGACTAPVITYFRQRLEVGWPYQMNPDNGDYTLLMPNLYTDLDRDAINGQWKPYTFYTYPWEKKKNKAFFRGSGYCNMWHRNKVVKCPRWHLTNESFYNGHGDVLDVRINGWDESGVGRKCPPYDPVPLREMPRYKYLLALDGVSASNRFAKLLGMNSVVLKEDSPYLAWFYRSVRQYEHYLPILERHPLDVLDIMGTYGAPQRDNELKRIVRNANNFAAKYMCDRAIALYFRKVLTEYKKLFDDMDGFIQGYIWPLVQAKQKTHVDFRQHLGRLRRQIAEDEAAAAAAKVASN